MKKRQLTNLLTTFMLLFSGIATAELPPYVYDRMHNEAPEKVQILVTYVTSRYTKSKHVKITSIEGLAKVLHVFRPESSKLAEGKTIKVGYQITRYGRGFTGPSEPIHIQSGETYIAYLAPDGNYYAPAAGGQSFLTPDTYQKYFHDQ